MQVTYNLERRDLWEGTWYSFTRYPPIPVIFVAYLLVSTWASWPAIVQHQYGEAAQEVGLKLAICAFLIYCLPAYVILRRLPSRTTVRTCTDKIDEWGYTCVVPEGQHKIAWRKVRQIGENPEYLFVMTNSGRCFPVAKRGFADTVEAELFKNKAIDYWQAARKGPPAVPDNHDDSWPPAPTMRS